MILKFYIDYSSIMMYVLICPENMNLARVISINAVSLSKSEQGGPTTFWIFEGRAGIIMRDLAKLN